MMVKGADMATTITTTRIGKLRRQFGVTQKTTARLLGLSERHLIDLENGHREPSATTERDITQLQRLLKRLSTVVKPAAIGPWMTRPNDAFDGDTPAALIESGKIDLLYEMIYDLRSGTAN
jgi:DNA-binding XRE family transcriptional regulator